MGDDGDIVDAVEDSSPLAQTGTAKASTVLHDLADEVPIGESEENSDVSQTIKRLQKPLAQVQFSDVFVLFDSGRVEQPKTNNNISQRLNSSSLPNPRGICNHQTI